MADRINIKISEVIEKASRGREMLVMEVDGFARHKVTCTLGKEVKADIMTDSLKQVGLKVHYVSLHGPQGGVVELSFRTGPITVYPHGTIVMDTSRDSLYWLPRSSPAQTGPSADLSLRWCFLSHNVKVSIDNWRNSSLRRLGSLSKAHGCDMRGSAAFSIIFSTE
jgi:hypothetical protein